MAALMDNRLCKVGVITEPLLLGVGDIGLRFQEPLVTFHELTNTQPPLVHVSV